MDRLQIQFNTLNPKVELDQKISEKMGDILSFCIKECDKPNPSKFLISEWGHSCPYRINLNNTHSAVSSMKEILDIKERSVGVSVEIVEEHRRSARLLYLMSLISPDFFAVEGSKISGWLKDVFERAFGYSSCEGYGYSGIRTFCSDSKRLDLAVSIFRSMRGMPESVHISLKEKGRSEERLLESLVIKEYFARMGYKLSKDNGPDLCFRKFFDGMPAVNKICKEIGEKLAEGYGLKETDTSFLVDTNIREEIEKFPSDCLFNYHMLRHNSRISDVFYHVDKKRITFYQNW